MSKTRRILLVTAAVLAAANWTASVALADEEIGGEYQNDCMPCADTQREDGSWSHGTEAPACCALGHECTWYNGHGLGQAGRCWTAHSEC
jgi:hypothetical protein